jgi:DNA end-binding protein Ku
MTARAIWKGVILFDEVRVSVRLYSAVVDRAIHFHLLHDQDMVRLQQRLVNSRTNQTVTYATARKAAPISNEELVMVDAGELEKLEPADSRDIHVISFVEPTVLSHHWFDRAYLLGPDGDETDFRAFTTALTRQMRTGICRWVMRKKRYLGALHVSEGTLMLTTLRHAADVIPVVELNPPSGPQLNPKEQRLAEQLIRALKDTFDPTQYQDGYQERIRALIRAKQKGKTVEVEEYEERPRAGTLESGLRASLRALEAR